MRPDMPDPVAFVSDALAARGALLERQDRGVLALLEEPLAHQLDCGTEVLLAAEATHGATACGLGTPLLDRLVNAARERAPVATVETLAAAPRVLQAQAAAERYVVRNAPARVASVTVGHASYVQVFWALRAEADDRHESLVDGLACVTDGSEPPAEAVEAWTAQGTRPWSGHPGGMERVAGWLAARAAAAASRDVQEFQGSVARRHRRDHDRVVGYFADMLREARTPRRRVDPATVAEKLAHLQRERDARLGDLGRQFAVRVQLRAAAVGVFHVPVCQVTLDVKRRKLAGQLLVRLCAGAHALDRVTCAACGGATAAPLLCDDALHPLCETCVPSAAGRPACRACR